MLDKKSALRLTAAVWIANVAVTALAVVGLDRQNPYFIPESMSVEPSFVPGPRHEQTAQVPTPGAPTEVGATAQAEDDEAPAIVMPMATIVARQHGRAEMQGAPDVVIGPGTVTHPAAIPPRRAR